MSQNILNTEQGSAFFVDLEQVIADETINTEKAKKKGQQHNKKHSGGTALYIPLFDKTTNSSIKNPQDEDTTNKLNLTFTKEDFERISAVEAVPILIKTVEHQETISMVAKNSNTNTDCSSPSSSIHHTEGNVRSSSAIQRVKATIGTLKKVHSSPDLLASPRLPQLEKSHQELTELITEYDKKEKEHFQQIWSTTYARLPKLPQWAITSNESLDLQPSLIIDKSSTTKKEEYSSTKQHDNKIDHQVKIEELYSDLNSRDKRNQQGSLPPIFSSGFDPSRKQGTTKSNVKKSTKKTGLCNSQNSPVTSNRNNRPRTNSANLNKPTKKNRSAAAVQKAVRVTRSASNKKKKSAKKSKRKDSNKSAESCKSDKETDILTSNVQEILDNVELNLACKTPIPEQQQDELLSNSGHFSMEDSIEVFYDNVLNARPSIETAFPFPNFNKYFNNMMEIKKNKDLYNTFENFTNAKYNDNCKAADFDLVESMEKTLSIDDTFLTTPNHHHRAFNAYPDLSKVTEEKSPFTTIQSKSNINSRLLLSSHNIFTTTTSENPSCSIAETYVNNIDPDDGHFEEITNLIFGPGGGDLISGSSLDSISINNSIISSSSNATVTERPYLKSVLGQASPRSLYTSSSNVSEDSSFSDNNILEWQKGKVIDRGAFGVVYQGLTNTGQMIAVKEVNINHSKNAAKNFKKLQDEINILKSLRHPNVIKFIGTSLDDNIVHIFMEYIAGGSLAGLISNFGSLNECIYQRYTKQIMSGVVYLHKRGVVHRDIKGANILITVKGNIKLIDFGCAKELSISVGATVMLKSVKGTPYWMSPETVRGTGCNHKSDIWSVGCTVMEMATGKPPWSEYPPYAAMYALADAQNEPPKLSTEHSNHARDFVEQCLHRDMNKRPSAEDLMSHPFIANSPRKR